MRISVHTKVQWTQQTRRTTNMTCAYSFICTYNVSKLKAQNLVEPSNRFATPWLDVTRKRESRKLRKMQMTSSKEKLRTKFPFRLFNYLREAHEIRSDHGDVLIHRNVIIRSHRRNNACFRRNNACFQKRPSFSRICFKPRETQKTKQQTAEDKATNNRRQSNKLQKTKQQTAVPFYLPVLQRVNRDVMKRGSTVWGVIHAGGQHSVIIETKTTDRMCFDQIAIIYLRIFDDYNNTQSFNSFKSQKGDRMCCSLCSTNTASLL